MRTENETAKSPCGGRDVGAFRICKAFRKEPKSTERQHVEVAHNGIHHVEGQVLLALLDVPKIKLLATHTGCYGSLRLALFHSQTRYRGAKNLSWRVGFSRNVRSNWLGHTVIVADRFLLI